MNNGFLVFAPFNIFLECDSEIQLSPYDLLGPDMIDDSELPSELAWQWITGYGNSLTPNLWDIKVDSVD